MSNLCWVSGESIQFVYNIHEEKGGKGCTESLRELTAGAEKCWLLKYNSMGVPGVYAHTRKSPSFQISCTSGLLVNVHSCHQQMPLTHTGQQNAEIK